MKQINKNTTAHTTHFAQRRKKKIDKNNETERSVFLFELLEQFIFLSASNRSYVVCDFRRCMPTTWSEFAKLVAQPNIWDRSSADNCVARTAPDSSCRSSSSLHPADRSPGSRASGTSNYFFVDRRFASTVICGQE